jgi:hypothetical protein
MLDLSNVTLVSIDSAADYEFKSNIRLAAISRIVPEIIKEIKFGDVLMINPFGKNKNLLEIIFEPHWKDFKLGYSPKNIAWLNNYLIKALPKLIKTEWYLIIQWDGFIVNSDKWNNEFFKYPFLGGGHSSLNGGFSLRNTNVMRKISEIENTFETGAEDGFYSCFLDNRWTENKNTPFKIPFPDEQLINEFCLWDSVNSNIPTFGWHRHKYLSKGNIETMFNKYQIFSLKELNKLVSYCLYKEIQFPVPDNEIIKLFDMEYNDEFFNNY